MKKTLGALVMVCVLTLTPVSIKAQEVNPNQALIDSLTAQIEILTQLIQQMLALQEMQNQGITDMLQEDDEEEQNNIQVDATPTGTITLMEPNPNNAGFSPKYLDITNYNNGILITVKINNGGSKNTPVFLDTPEGTLTMGPGAGGGYWHHSVGYQPSSAGLKHFTVRAPEFNVSKSFDIEFIHQDWVEQD